MQNIDDEIGLNEKQWKRQAEEKTVSKAFIRRKWRQYQRIMTLKMAWNLQECTRLQKISIWFMIIKFFKESNCV